MYEDLGKTINVINGHGKLELIPGKEYDIHFGYYRYTSPY